MRGPGNVVTRLAALYAMDGGRTYVACSSIVPSRGCAVLVAYPKRWNRRRSFVMQPWSLVRGFGGFGSDAGDIVREQMNDGEMQFYVRHGPGRLIAER